MNPNLKSDSLILPLGKTDYQEIIEVWEASVRATHHFLKEGDIQYFKSLILAYYLDTVALFGVRSESKKLLGFLGVHEDKIEMLFLHPDSFGKGIGKQLTLFAIHDLGATKVDVNEDNPQAVGFYEHVGFKTVSRSELDPLGKPFPILSMEFASVGE